jgi:ADP-ribose pyrophosphatase
MVQTGEITNAAAVAGLLAAARARDGGWAALRPADSALPG